LFAARGNARDFTAEDRLRYREALERVRYELRAGPGAPRFEAVVKRERIAEEVRIEEKKARLLRDYCGLEITEHMIQEELSQMKSTYQRPELVLKIADALDRDPRAIVEFWVKPILVDRYLRACVANDPEFNAKTREYAEELAKTPDDEIAESPGWSRISFSLSDPSISPEDSEALLYLQPGERTGAIESPFDFHVFRVVSRQGETVTVDAAYVQKLDFEQWLEAQP